MCRKEATRCISLDLELSGRFEVNMSKGNAHCLRYVNSHYHYYYYYYYYHHLFIYSLPVKITNEQKIYQNTNIVFIRNVRLI